RRPGSTRSIARCSRSWRQGPPTAGWFACVRVSHSGLTASLRRQLGAPTEEVSVHVPSATGGSNADGRPTADLSIRELFDLNSYWLAINILWGALGISLLPILIIDTVCGGDQVCGD